MGGYGQFRGEWVKTESIWKLGHFNFQRTKTLYENILSHLAFFLGTDNFNFMHAFFFSPQISADLATIVC